MSYKAWASLLLLFDILRNFLSSIPVFTLSYIFNRFENPFSSILMSSLYFQFCYLCLPQVFFIAFLMLWEIWF
jgi:hypothetical protein